MIHKNPKSRKNYPTQKSHQHSHKTPHKYPYGGHHLALRKTYFSSLLKKIPNDYQSCTKVVNLARNFSISRRSYQWKYIKCEVNSISLHFPSASFCLGKFALKSEEIVRCEKENISTVRRFFSYTSVRRALRKAKTQRSGYIKKSRARKL